MKHIIYSGPTDLDIEIMQGLAKGEKVFLIDVFTMCFNPHDALETYDDLESYVRMEQAEFHVRMRGMTNTFVLAAFAPAIKKWVNKHNNVVMHKVETFGFGSASDLIRAANHNEDLASKISGIISDTYGVEEKDIRAMMERGVFLTSDDLERFNGIEVITDLLATAPGSPEAIDDPDQAKKDQMSDIDGVK